MKSEIWKQSIDDGLSAHIDYGETEATILYGVRLEKAGNNYAFFIAYEGDFYRKMPPNYVDTILELGWRKGLCQLLVDRCERNIEARRSSLERQINSEAPDQKEIDRLGVVISNLEAKRDKYAVQPMTSKLHKMLDTNKRCKHIKREGESCRLNNNCTYPDCEIETFNTK